MEPLVLIGLVIALGVTVGLIVAKLTIAHHNRTTGQTGRTSES